MSISAVFNLVNSGDPITRDILEKVLSRVYPEDSMVSKAFDWWQGITNLNFTLEEFTFKI